MSAKKFVLHRGFRFGQFRLDLDRAELFENDEPVKLRRQSFDVLRYLLEHHGRLIEKRELIQAIWGDAAVTEDSLTHCIIDIRRVLGDRDRNMIHTVQRRGFVFDVPVERISSANRPVPAKYKEVIQATVLLVVAATVVLLSINEFRPGTNDPVPVSREAQDRYAQARFLFNRRAPGDRASAREYYLQAIELQRRALDREPLSFTNRGNLSYYLFAAGRYEEALQENQRAYKLHPASTAQPDTLPGFALIMLQRYTEALQLIDKWPAGPSKNSATAMANLKLGHEHEAAVAIELLLALTSADAYLRRAELLAFCEQFDSSFAILAMLRESLPTDAATRLQKLELLDDVYLSPFLAPLRKDRRWESWLSGLRTTVVATL